VYKNPMDGYYLTFHSKKNFELEMYSCTYRIKVSGTYIKTKDTVYLNFKKFYERDESYKWVVIDTATYEDKESIDFEINLASKYKKLVREGHDLKSLDRKKRTFRPRNRTKVKD